MERSTLYFDFWICTKFRPRLTQLKLNGNLSSFVNLFSFSCYNLRKSLPSATNFGPTIQAGIVVTRWLECEAVKHTNVWLSLRSVTLYMQARKIQCSVLLVVDVWEIGKTVTGLGENMLDSFLSKLTDCCRNISIYTKRLICFDISFFPQQWCRKANKKTPHFCLQGCYIRIIDFRRSLFLRTEQYKSVAPNLIIILYILFYILSRDLPWAFHWAKASWLFSQIVTILHEQCWQHQKVCLCFIVFLLWKILSMHLLITETPLPEF